MKSRIQFTPANCKLGKMTALVFICASFDDLSKASESNNKFIPEIVDQEKISTHEKMMSTSSPFCSSLNDPFESILHFSLEQAVVRLSSILFRSSGSHSS